MKKKKDDEWKINVYTVNEPPEILKEQFNKAVKYALFVLEKMQQENLAERIAVIRN